MVHVKAAQHTFFSCCFGFWLIWAAISDISYKQEKENRKQKVNKWIQSRKIKLNNGSLNSSSNVRNIEKECLLPFLFSTVHVSAVCCSLALAKREYWVPEITLIEIDTDSLLAYVSWVKVASLPVVYSTTYKRLAARSFLKNYLWLTWQPLCNRLVSMGILLQCNENFFEETAPLNSKSTEELEVMYHKGSIKESK